jgi:hypothetical protein
METLAIPPAHMETTGMQDHLTTVRATPTGTEITPEFLGTEGTMGVIIAVVITGAIMSSRAGGKRPQEAARFFSSHYRLQPVVCARLEPGAKLLEPPM